LIHARARDAHQRADASTESHPPSRRVPLVRARRARRAHRATMLFRTSPKRRRDRATARRRKNHRRCASGRGDGDTSTRRGRCDAGRGRRRDAGRARWTRGECHHPSMIRVADDGARRNAKGGGARARHFWDRFSRTARRDASTGVDVGDTVRRVCVKKAPVPYYRFLRLRWGFTTVLGVSDALEVVRRARRRLGWIWSVGARTRRRRTSSSRRRRRACVRFEWMGR